MLTWVDPPSGWKFGFPKLYDSAKDGSVHEWLLREGYPQKELDDMPYFRQWEDTEIAS